MPNETSYLRQVLRLCAPVLASAAAISLAVNVLILAVPLFSIQLFDRVLTSESQATLIVITAGVLVALMISAGLELARSRVLVRLGAWLERTLTAPLFTNSVRDGRLGANFRDLEKIRSVFMGNALLSVFDAPWTPIFIAVLFFLHAWLGWIAVAGAVLLTSAAVANNLLTQQSQNRAAGSAANQFRAANAITRQRDSLVSMGMEKALCEWWRRQINGASVHYQAAGDRMGALLAASRLVRLWLQIMVLATAAHLVIAHEVSPGAMVAASILLSRALAPVEHLISGWRQLAAAKDAVIRIGAVLSTYREANVMPLPAPRGRIEVTDVAFAPMSSERPVFSNVNFEINPGQFVALVGPSGAGKTSLIRMIVGAMTPSDGIIRFDGADVTRWSAEDRGQYVGYVPQHVEFMPGTVAENICRFSKAAPEAIYAATKKVNVHDAILRLPDGYQTMIGGDNEILSAGMRQRVALSRAVFGNPCLLILDEPYSNLDTAGVEDLISLVEQFSRGGGSVLMATHRPSIYVRADQAFEMRDGKLVEFSSSFKSPQPQIHAVGAAANAELSPEIERLFEASA